jgi:hypothetical protein
MKSFCCCPLFAAYAALGVCVTLHDAMGNNADGIVVLQRMQAWMGGTDMGDSSRSNAGPGEQ